MSYKLKIAVQFFGHLRTFEKCASSVKQYLLDQYDCDVFMHTWSETEHSTQTWHNQKSDIINVDDSILKKINTYYTPKAIKIEEQVLSNEDIKISCQNNYGKTVISTHGLKNMLYSKQQVNLLRQEYELKNNVKYDYIVMIRPDILLKSVLNISNVDRQVTVSKSISSRYCASNIVEDNNFSFIGDLASDILYFGKPEVIDSVIMILNNINFDDKMDQMWNPENLFNNELLNHQVNSQFINYLHGKDWEILRKIQLLKSRKQFIRLNIRKNCFIFNLLSILPISLINLNCRLFKTFLIEITIGKL